MLQHVENYVENIEKTFDKTTIINKIGVFWHKNC